MGQPIICTPWLRRSRHTKKARRWKAIPTMPSTGRMGGFGRACVAPATGPVPGPHTRVDAAAACL